MIFKLMNDDSAGVPIIKVIGVGGGGSNAVTHMYEQGIVGVEFAICNTDAQAMKLSPVPTKIHLGPELTEGRGAGSKPVVGKMACEESIEEVRKYMSDNCKMVFITAGMGGGTGTGAAPIIAKAAQEMGILTVGIVTLPFTFEGRRRTNQGMEGLEELKAHVDTLIVISNDKLRQIYGSMTLRQAFSQADNILTTAAKGIAEIITVPGYVNVDFEDVNTVMRDSGVAIMGTAVAEGENRAKKAVDEALNSPLLEDNNIRGAQNILVNITSGTKEVTMDEIFEITEWVQEEAGYGTNLIWGNCYDENLGEALSVTVIATGFEREKDSRAASQEERRVRVSLDDEPRRSAQAPPQPGLRQPEGAPRFSAPTPPRTGGLRDIGFDGGDPYASNATDANTPGSTIEFDATPANKYGFSYDRPYLSSEQEKQMEARRLEEMRDRETRRRERMNQLRPKLTPETVVKMENEPAYKRRNVELDPVGEQQQEISEWSVRPGAEGELDPEGNSYLHRRVD